ESPHSCPRHRRDGAGRTLLDQRVRAERLRRTNTKSRDDDVVPRQLARQLVRAVRIATLHPQPRMPARDLRRRADERGDLMATGEGEVDQLCSGLAVGAEDEEPHGPASYPDDRIGEPRVTGKGGATRRRSVRQSDLDLLQL